MLENTFCHVPGIGPTVERRLWSVGVRSWSEAQCAESLPLSATKAQTLRDHLAASATHLADDNPHYFYDLLPPREHWRLFREFQHTTAYLDIETTGLGGPDDIVTTIVLYDGQNIRHYVRDDNLMDFRDDIADYQLLVTYNGKTFDVPFLRKFLGVAMNHAHIDLRYVLASLGYRGGLKACEKRLGLGRTDLAEVDGFFAVLLWWDYRNNANPKALETLLAYNTLDVVNLATLMPMAYNMKLKATPFARSRQLAVPQPPPLPFKPDLPTIQRIRHEHGW